MFEEEQLWVIYPGNQKYALDDKFTVLPLEETIKLPEISRLF
jgi:hypothetical protein